MSFTLTDNASVLHSMNSETVRGTSTEMLAHSLKSTTSGGGLPYRNLDLDENGVLVDIGAIQLYGAKIWNDNASKRYLKIYDIATAPTSSDTPKFTFPLKAQDYTELPSYALGVEFQLGLGLRATTGLSDSDTGAPSTNDVVLNASVSSLAGFVVGVVGSCVPSATAPVVTG